MMTQGTFEENYLLKVEEKLPHNLKNVLKIMNYPNINLQI